MQKNNSVSRLFVVCIIQLDAIIDILLHCIIVRVFALGLWFSVAVDQAHGHISPSSWCLNARHTCWLRQHSDCASVEGTIPHTIEKLLDEGLPKIYTSELFEQKTTAVFQHVYDAYYGAGRSVYAVAWYISSSSSYLRTQFNYFEFEIGNVIIIASQIKRIWKTTQKRCIRIFVLYMEIWIQHQIRINHEKEK